ncbi:UDP-N-acetylmuramoyl-L-alanyl-D-glutamate--2,6-diaminopimelate ligase [Roseateles oligotrophus]|uniref:UDP-N-acetylmuramoyl-L-alanyl-D-glutamate--2,6-diaminopimelate ligase n=1 Tax=Roseateles oligotrophus TaxID=1769250 RepID=A0ABT2YE95_9BURK|nr:UDP-N-acetylmuramoyl-L-alanyl-D-glutamate--2,6-diaminopimelate ligase [Roseateles oligotrophus]MCV2368375.1 UDP-N-acetylmuramoyl-L-alanyl-D-glutamate--2,6-diaminopimelate ligase [Roseateles oligotrophus]
MLTRLKSPEACARWLQEWTTGVLRTDSRAVQPGDAFIAWPGYARDGREFVAQALAAGASTCLVEDAGVESYGFVDARVASLPDLKSKTGLIAAAYYGQPSKALSVIATTGTNGKTSTAWWCAQALSLLGQRCGVVGTLGVGEPPIPGRQAAAIEYTGLTTPDPVLLQANFRRMQDEGYAACAIEASSIGLKEFRLSGSEIRVALFTNFTQDHLDYHGTMDAYWAAKRELFEAPGLRAAVLNIDDAKGTELALELAAKLDVWTCSLNGPARLRATDLHYLAGGLAFTLREGEQALLIETGLIGEYNVANLLGVIGCLRALGHGLAEIAAVAGQVTSVPGRMQRVGNGLELPQLVVDYAHTPDALDKALTALQPLAAARGGQLICVFGCGGNRDRAKRPAMGAIAAAKADKVILTSDNPRHEEPAQILADIAAGMPGEPLSMVDRRAAIQAAVLEAGPRDVILVAGKGHEDYQEVAGQRQPFSDVEEARLALIARAGL